MPVTTRSITEKSDEKPNSQETSVKMATPEPTSSTKKLSIQDILDSINNLEVKLNNKMDEQVKILKKNQDEAFKKAELRINGFEQDLND